MKKYLIELFDNVELDGIDWNDYPDFCDMYLVSADYEGRPLTNDEIEELNNDSQLIYELYLRTL
jgi:hypothetical protein